MFKIGFAVLCLCAMVNVAMAEAFQPFTILSNNSDTQNGKLYVEVMYQKPACGHYQAMFKLVDRVGTTLYLPIDSVLNNAGTYKLSANKRALKYPQTGGYKLRFKLPVGARPADSLVVHVESYRLGSECRGCGSAGSNVIFEPKHVKAGCPYQGTDVIACNLQKGEAANWEAWIQDSRDCNPYRIVQMPDGSWWFAQNLNFQKELEGRTTANVGGNGVGSFWCPGPQGGNSTYNRDLSACAVYGALYTWSGIMSKDGRGAAESEAGYTQRSLVRGICPEGWHVPGFYDWGRMLNSVEDVADTSHLNVSLGDKGRIAGKRLKSTIACGSPNIAPTLSQGLQTPCANATSPAWTYYLDLPKVITSSRFAENFYGLGLIAAGRRNAAVANGFDKTPGTDAYYWSATQASATEGAAREFSASSNGAAYGIANKDQVAYSVRCVAVQ